MGIVQTNEILTSLVDEDSPFPAREGGRGVRLQILTLYSRSDCHLCEQAHAIVMSLLDTFGYEVRVVDIDRDAALVERYGVSIPVVSLDGEDVLAWPFTRAMAYAVLQQRLGPGR
ncbi:MAG: glutaredoxin family protein [Dehalococcoidia bacterium]